MAEQGGLQLIPETKRRIDIRSPGANRFLIVGLIILAIAVAIWVFVRLWRAGVQASLDEVNAQVQSIERNRDKGLERELLRAASQLGVVSNLVNDHILLTKGFERLETLLKPDVQLKNLSFDALTGRISAQAAARSYTTVARQLAVFLNDEFIKDTKISSIEGDPSGKLNFGLDITFDEQRLIRLKSANTVSNP